MRGQIGRASKPAVAVGAGERFGTGVDALVHLQLHLLREPRRADLAVERSVAGVGTLVNDEVRASDETFPARSTDVGPLPGVDPDVLRHVTRLPEHPAADRTRERSRTGVRALVIAQLAHGAETLLARTALKRLLSAVNPSVYDQFSAASVRLPTHVTTVRTFSCIKPQHIY